MGLGLLQNPKASQAESSLVKWTTVVNIIAAVLQVLEQLIPFLLVTLYFSLHLSLGPVGGSTSRLYIIVFCMIANILLGFQCVFVHYLPAATHRYI